MFARLSYGWSLGVGSWRAIWNNKTLLILPCLSLAAQLVVLFSYVAAGDPLGMQQILDRGGQEGASGADQAAALAALFVFYTVFNTITIFFNVALISCAGRALSGRPAGITRGLWDAVSRLHYVLMWAAISASVAVALRALQSHRKTRRLLIWLLGSVWSVLTYLVLPVMVYERRNPFAALLRSKDLIFNNWGETIGGSIGVGVVGFLLMLPAMTVLYIGIATQSAPLLLTGFGIVLLVMLWNATAGSLLTVAVYATASHKQLKTNYFPELEDVFFTSQGARSLSPTRRTMDNRVKGSDGGTQMHDAAAGGHRVVVEVMLKRGGNAFAKDSQGRTPLDCARQSGQGEVARLLEAWMTAHSEDEVVFDA